MTVLLTVAVKPKDGLKPYVLMGSDSLRLRGRPVYSKNDEFLGFEDEMERIEDSQKIFQVNTKLVGITGKFNDDLADYLLNYIEESDCEIERLSQLVARYAKRFLEEGIEDFDYQRITITLGSCDDSKPIISYIEVDTRDLSNVIIDVCEVTEIGSFVPVFAGNRRKTKDLQDAFNDRVLNGSVNFNITAVRRAAKEYLEKAAARYPETCNQKIAFKRLR